MVKKKKWSSGGPTMIVLSSGNLSPLETISIGTLIGTAVTINKPGDWGTSTYTITSDPDNKFDVSGADIETDAALSYEAATSHQFTVTDTPSGPYSPIAATFTVNVVNVLETTLNALALDSATLLEGSPENTVVGSLINTSSGSTLTLIDAAGSRFKLSGDTIVAGPVGTSYSDGSYNITVRESHADGNNSPRDSVITITITELVSGSDVLMDSQYIPILG